MTDVELAIRYLENMVNSQYWRLIENTDYFCEIKENILILIKELKSNSIPKSKIETEIKYLNSKYDLENDYFKTETVINILKELLEESE